MFQHQKTSYCGLYLSVSAGWLIWNRPALHNWDVRLRLSLRCTSVSAPIRGTEVNLIIISVVSYPKYVSEVFLYRSCSLVFQCFAKRFQIPQSWRVTDGFVALQQEEVNASVFKSVFVSVTAVLQYEPCAVNVAEKLLTGGSWLHTCGCSHTHAHKHKFPLSHFRCWNLVEFIKVFPRV